MSPKGKTPLLKIKEKVRRITFILVVTTLRKKGKTRHILREWNRKSRETKWRITYWNWHRKSGEERKLVWNWTLKIEFGGCWFLVQKQGRNSNVVF
jgi:hypothetical protein